ncbi:MAG: hypothetical protein M0R28_04685 [Pigmentiphaga sp.]|nr:hypothetical protein [Pigmentiphaga sp.]
MSQIHWSFEKGRLVARNESQQLLWSALAEEQIGMELAVLLNRAPRLSQELLMSAQPDDKAKGAG